MHRSIIWCCVVAAACGDNADPSPPTLENLSLTTAEDTPIAFEVPVAVRFPNATSLTVLDKPANGELQGSGPKWTYAPVANYSGDDTVVVHVEDPYGSATATVSIHVTPSNDAPTAEADSFAGRFETPLTIAHATLLGNDTDVDSSSLAIIAVAAGSHGTPTLSNGTIVFTPETGFEGVATFSYSVSDGELDADATVTVTIGTDEAPVAVGDAATTDEDVPLQLADSVLVANDTDVEHQTLAISAVGTATHGTVSHAGNQVTFVPDANYFGPASFEYTVTDGYKTSVATVAVTVTSINDVPVATADVGITDEDAPLGVSVTSLLANDSDVENDTLTVVAVTPGANTHGTVTLAGGIVTYAPDADYNGAATFSYTVSDGNGGDTTATVTITVDASDDVPVAVDDSALFDEDGSATAITVLSNDTDVDGGAIAIVSVTQPVNGAVIITGGGTGLTYEPTPNYCNKVSDPTLVAIKGALSSIGFGLGPQLDTFTYTLAPGGSTATVSVTVTCSDDAPSAAADVATVAEDSSANMIDVIANDTDLDGGAMTVASVTQPAHGSVSVASNGSGVVYTPSPNYCNEAPNTAPDTFTYSLSPGGSSATVSVTVTCACGKNKPTDFVVGSN